MEKNCLITNETYQFSLTINILFLIHCNYLQQHYVVYVCACLYKVAISYVTLACFVTVYFFINDQFLEEKYSNVLLECSFILFTELIKLFNLHDVY